MANFDGLKSMQHRDPCHNFGVEMKALDIPRGDTCPGVNRAVLEHLLSLERDFAGELFLDVPCGRGDFLDTIHLIFPAARTLGADKVRHESFAHQFYEFDAESGKGLDGIGECSVVTCISGVMEFDNTLAFFRSLRRLFDDSALLIVTNDNLLTVRDRLLYAFFGRFGQYRSMPGRRGPTWKMLHLSNLERLLDDAGFRVDKVRYVVGSWTAWLWLPLAVPLYLAQLLYFLTAEHDIPFDTKRRYYPFVSTLARHYLFVCAKVMDAETDDAADESE